MAYQNYCQCSRLYLLVFSCGYSTTQETQHELDTFPRHARCKKHAFLCFPDFNFQSVWSHRHCSYSMLWVVTVAWLYIKPFRGSNYKCLSKEPTGDPVDSDPDVITAKAALSEPTVLSHTDFAIQCEILTVFTHLACSRRVCILSAILTSLGVDRHPRTT